MNGSGWSPPLHILDIHQIAARAGSGASFHVRFWFEVVSCRAGPIQLVLETPDQFGICVNGQRVAGGHAQGWWIDTAFRRFDITAALQVGRNEVMLCSTFTRATELESIYITGDFGVTSVRVGRENQLAGQVFDRYAPVFRLCSRPDRRA